VLGGDVARPLDVRAHELGSLIGVVLAQRLDDLAVLLLDHDPVLGRIGHVRLVDRRHRGDLAHHPGQPLAAGGLEDAAVEREVLLRELGQHLARGAQLAEAVAALFELADLPVGDPLGRPACCLALERGTQRVELDQVLGLIPGHGGAAVALCLDEAVALEEQERLTDRRPAGAQLLGELDLRQRRARRKPPVEDRPADRAEQGSARLLDKMALGRGKDAHRRENSTRLKGDVADAYAGYGMLHTDDGVYERAGFGHPIVRGTRPALIVVDFSRGFTEPEFPTGADLTAQVTATARLIEAMRAKGRPVFFTVITFQANLRDAGAWLTKFPGARTLIEGTPAGDLDPRLPVAEEDTVIVKKGASAFFGTSLAAMLAAERVDTAIVCGATTSGCVRASVVDSMQYGFQTMVVRDCVGDRAQGPHEANLFDMQAKYADVVDLDEALDYVSGLPA